MATSYVVDGATLKCSKGGTCKLKVAPGRNTFIQGKPQANVNDYTTKNIPKFNFCSIPKHHQCRLSLQGPWKSGKNDVIIEGAPALMHKSKIKCAKGGVISIQKHNQCLESDGAVVLPVSASTEEKESSIKENSSTKDDYKIIFRGNDNTNSSSRSNYHPLIIVNHITATMSFSSTDDWFRSSDNNVSSAHFVINREGKIYQYVPIERMAWVNGIKGKDFDYVTSQFVKSKGKINPNLYSVGIEHTGTDGTLTEDQFKASVWLHKYIQSYVIEKWNHTIKFDRKHVIGHYEIDPINKSFCPGPNFPWDRLISNLNS